MKKKLFENRGGFIAKQEAEGLIAKQKGLALILGGVILGLIALWILFFSNKAAINYAFPNHKVEDKEPERVNILMLGMAGGKHDGATLTDSIIVGSYHTKTHKVVLISIPRDLWADEVSGKVNSVYQTGLKDSKGLEIAKKVIGEDITGMNIDYAIRIDFSGFSKAIDQVGGVDVEVPRTFDDYNYPITGKEDDLCGNKEEEVELTEEQAKILNTTPGKKRVIVDPSGKVATDDAVFACRFEHIHYDKGLTHMDGTTALKFVRSRHALGPEGSDFARSKRQQLVIEAFKNKVLSLGTLANPQKIGGLISILGSSLETDIPLDKYLQFYKYAQNVESVESIVLGDLGEGKTILETGSPSKYDGYVLIPPEGDFSKVHELIQQKLDDQASTTPKPTATPKAKTTTPSK